jgi:hypothetical protein
VLEQLGELIIFLCFAGGGSAFVFMAFMPARKMSSDTKFYHRIIGAAMGVGMIYLAFVVK